jgi:DNA-binding MarR family transcriptional regulator
MSNEKSTPLASSDANRAVHAALRAFSSQTAWHSHAVASAAGMHATDLEILDLLDQHGDLTAGRLAELSGLTTGAITGVIDRLELGEHVQRVRDPDDRRRVVVRKTATNYQKMGELYLPLSISLDALLARYTPSQLEAIADYADRAATALAEDAARLRQGADGDHDDTGTGPVEVAPMSATLQIVRGLSKASLRGDAGAKELVGGRFWRATPTLRREGDTVSLSYRSGVFGSMLMGARIALHTLPLWTIEATGGISFATLDLVALKIRALKIHGGVRAVSIALPRPHGIVPVTIAGGANELQIDLGPESDATASFVGGTNRTSVNGRALNSKLTAVIGSAKSPNRYEISIVDGATKVAING